MKITIIGGGWVGCHLAKKLILNHDVKIYDKNKSLFEESSYKNQNRLHLGYHYSRNHKTRELCKNTFQKFIEEYEAPGAAGGGTPSANDPLGIRGK